MTASSELLRQLSVLPDWAVLTDQQTSQVLGLSVDTLRRLDRDHDGPPWVRLSPRRRGRSVGGLRKWIKQRESASFHEPQALASDSVGSLDGTTCNPDAKVRLATDTSRTPRGSQLKDQDD